MSQIFCSRKSIHRLIKRYLGLCSHDACVHQTLTFRENLQDRARAKKCLKRWLDNMHRQFEMASLWVEEEQERGAIHFHVILFPFGDAASQDTEAITEAGFRAWKATVNSPRPLSRAANKVKVRPRNASLLIYVLGEVLPMEEFTGKPPVTRWWGYRQNKLARKHWREPSKSEVAALFSEAFDTRVASQKALDKPAKPKPQFYSINDLRREKADVDAWEQARQKIDWEWHKRRETGSKKPVSDNEFMDFKNREWWAYKARSSGKDSKDDPFAWPE